MKPGNIFWGAFLISIGVFFLLDNLEIATFAIDRIWVYWPILLIIWGISIMKIPNILKLIMSGLSGVFLSLVIISLINTDWTEDIDWNIKIGDNPMEDTASINETDYDLQKMNFKMDSKFKVSNLNFDGGAGSFNISGTCEDLIMVSTGGAKAILKQEVVDSLVNVDLEVAGNSIKIDKNYPNRFAKINLNPDIIWNMNISAGAAKINLDLSQHKVETLNLDAGAIDLDMKIGTLYKNTTLNISTGASNMEIEIPKDSGCIIYTDIALSDKNFAGFKKLKPGMFATENYQNSSNLVNINLDGGLSSIKVNRY